MRPTANDRFEKIVSDNLVSFVLPKELRLGDPRLTAAIAKKGKEFRVTLTAEQPALWTWLSLENGDARYSDNFVHVTAGAPVEIVVHPEHPLSQTEFTKALRVRSLFDTYQA